jgi:hypothetical protein
MRLKLTQKDLKLLTEALESHRYWQLSDEQYRRDGYIVDPGADDPERRAELADVQQLQNMLQLEQKELAKHAIREQLAEYAHNAWSGWMMYLFEQTKSRADGSEVIPLGLVKRWRRQLSTPYRLLPGDEQESDRAEADKILAIASPWGEK